MSTDENTAEQWTLDEPEPARARRLKVGEIVESYCVEAALGQGSMARVWRVRHIRLQTQRALKVLQEDPESWLARFHQEGALQARLHHPNILRVHDILYVHERPALLMDHADGGSLAEHIGEELDLDRCRRWVQDALQGLAAAHSVDVIHRDIKPSNLLLVSQPRGGERVVVADFGIARQLNQEGLTMTHGLLGTPAYMSPEQIHDPRAVTPASDIFSLGVSLYQLLSGRLPFHGEDVRTQLNATVEGTYEPITGCPEDLARLIDACLHLDPKERPTASQALEMLETSELPILAPAPKPRSKVPWIIAGVATLGALSLLAIPKKAPPVPMSLKDDTQEERAALLEAALSKSAATPGEAFALGRAASLLGDGDPRVDPPIQSDLAIRGAHMRVLPAEHQVFRILVTPDQRTVVGVLLDGGVMAWDRATGEHKFTHKISRREQPADATISPDSRLLAVVPDTVFLSGGTRARVRLLDIETGRLLHTFSNGDATNWVSFRFHPTLPVGMTSSDNGYFTLWDLETGAPKHRVKPPGTKTGSMSDCGAFSPNGDRYLFLGDDRHAHELDPETGAITKLWRFPQMRRNRCFMVWRESDPDAIVVHMADALQRMNVKTGKVLARVRVKSRRPPLHGDGIIAFFGENNDVRIHGYPFLELRHVLKHPRRVYGMTMDARSRQIATASSDGLVRVWSTHDGVLHQRLQGHKSWVLDLTSTNIDGRWELWSGGRDHTARAWPLDQPWSIAIPAKTSHRRWDEQGRHMIAIDTQNRLQYSDLTTEILRARDLSQERPSILRKVRISKDGRYAMEVRQEGMYVHHLRGDFQTVFIPGLASSVSFGPFGPAHAVLTRKGKDLALVRLSFDRQPSYTVDTFPYPRKIGSAHTTEHGEYLFVIDHEYNLRVYDLKTLEHRDLRTECNHVAATHAKGARMVLGDWNGLLEVWDFERGERLGTHMGHEDAITKVQQLGEGRILSSSRDHTLRLWKGDNVKVLRGHSNEVVHFDVSPDERQVVSLGRDRTLIVWDLVRGEAIHSLQTTRQMHGVWWKEDRIRALDDHGVTWEWKLSDLRNDARYDNLRVCRGTKTVVPTTPFGRASVWADPKQCGASGP